MDYGQPGMLIACISGVHCMRIKESYNINRVNNVHYAFSLKITVSIGHHWSVYTQYLEVLYPNRSGEINENLEVFVSSLEIWRLMSKSGASLPNLET
jgi:hypothetical protein